MSFLIIAGLLQWLVFIVALVVWALVALAYRYFLERNDDLREHKPTSSIIRTDA